MNRKTESQTDTTENIAFPQLRWRTAKIIIGIFHSDRYKHSWGVTLLTPNQFPSPPEKLSLTKITTFRQAKKPMDSLVMQSQITIQVSNMVYSNIVDHNQ